MLSRIMVGIPSAENREMILKTLLAKEKYENVDFKELSIMTKGYSGSDLKVHFVGYSNSLILVCGDDIDIYFCKQNLCTAAAYRPVRELLRQERNKEKVIT